MILPSGQIVFDPRGVVTAEHKPLAQRLASLSGARLAVLDNSKWNASKLLKRTVALVERDHELAAVRYYVKDSFSRTASPELVDRIVRENDAVLTAVGD